MVRKLQLAISVCMLLLLVCMYLWTGSLLACTYVAVAMILLAILALCPFLFANTWYKNKNRHKNQFTGTDKFITGTKYRTDHTRNFDVANVGSTSGVFAFEYEDTGLAGCNWAMAPESLAYNFRVLKNYFSLLRDGSTVIFTMTPFGFCLKDYADGRANAKYYLYLSPISILDYSRWKRLLYRTCPLLSSPIKALKCLVRDIPADNRLHDV